MLSHYSVVNNAAALVEALHINENDKICVTVPLFHTFGITADMLVSLHSLCPMCIMEYFSLTNIFQWLEEGKCTVLNGVPSMFLGMLENSFRKDFDISSIKKGIIAGSPISIAEYNRICEGFKIDKLLMSYGQTETSPCVSISDYDEPIEAKADNAGKIIENVEVRIQDGEIQTRGYHVMQGYYELPEENAKVFTPDGWLKTGDAGFLDSQGRLHITGRLTEIIIRGGENISPREIESYIAECENIKQVKVTSIATPVIQEEIVACIITKDGKEMKPEVIQDYVGNYLAAYKVPKYVLTFDNFPLTTNGKIDLGAIKRIACERIAGKEKCNVFYGKARADQEIGA
jgi:fatty-acyl-CoA synthase